MAETTSTETARAAESAEWHRVYGTVFFTGKSALVEALLDAVGSAHVEGLGDLLVHETLPVEDVCHHHPQVKHLQQLCDGGHLHQISPGLVQTARVQVLEHRLEPVHSSFTSHIHFPDKINSNYLFLFPVYHVWELLLMSQRLFFGLML